MLKTRIIPTLLWKGFGLVKGVQFNSWRRIGTVLPAIKVYNMREVDELILLDISATLEDRSLDLSSISEFSAECFVPLTIGGGIKNIDDFYGLLSSGADKVAVNSAAIVNPELVRQASERFGSQCIVMSIDARLEPTGNYQVYTHAGTVATGIAPIEAACKAEDSGAGEILLTSINNDGAMKGVDLNLIRRVSDSVNIPVIASGGVKSYEDMYLALSRGRASAISAASIFHFTEQTPIGAKRYLKERGIPVRLNY